MQQTVSLRSLSRLSNRHSLLVFLSLLILALTSISYAAPIVGPVTPANSIVGSHADDRIGSEGIYALPSGNVVIASRYWNGSRGAVTCLTSAEYKGGGVIVSDTNSLTGATAGNEVGLAVTVLSNGNYVVSSRNWDDGLTLNVGAVTWVNGNTCIPFGESSKGVVVSASNSLIGSQTNDQVGNATYALANGNYLVTSPSWDNGGAVNAGAVTWGNGATGLVGVVSAVNSLVGSTANDGIGGRTATELSNGNVVIHEPSWDNPVGPIVDVGMVVWINGATGKTGPISASNAMIGAVAFDFFSLSGVTALANGHYVVGSRFFNNAGVAAGAITWGDGVTGTVGVASIANSLLGSTNGDFIGHIPLTALDNGSFVMRAPIWDNAGVANAGAVVWGSGTAPITGIISAANALVGQTENDLLGDSITPLALGGFVVSSTNWDNGAVVDAGAATWGSGTAPLFGTISAANSLIGSTADDKISSDGIFALTNGNYVVTSSFWDNGGTVDVGAVTWGNRDGSTVGTVSSTNSLIGTSANDRVSDSLSLNRATIALTNGNYVVTSRQWDDGATADVGAVTWVNGSAPVVGVVSAANSLIGTTAGDAVGYIDALPNGYYLVRSSNWDNGAIVNAGAATLGDGTIGTVGVVSTSNSLVGVTAGDQVGRSLLQPILANGNYLVVTETWNDGLGGIAVGAVTWCDAVTGCAGETVNTTNSIVGSRNLDLSGMSVIVHPNGDYLLVAKFWDNGGQADAGALVYGDGTRKTSLVVSDTTALVGVNAGDNLGAKYAILPDHSVFIGSSGWDDGATLNVGAVAYIAGTGVTVSQTAVSATEGGMTGSYTVVLNTKPTADVTVTVTGDADVSVSPALLTFTAANWNSEQTVTVTAIDDLIAEGGHSGVITHSTTSADMSYHAIGIAGVSVSITDNDTAGVTVSQTAVDATEGGATGSYTVVLNTEPTADVTVTVTGDAQASVSPATLTFAPSGANAWNLAQTVTVTAVDDALVEGGHSGAITHSASGGGYAAISIAGVSVNISDNDTVGVTVGGTVSGLAGSGLVLRNNGGDDLAVNANGAFTFATALADGSGYAVTVLAQPGSPSQTCTVSNGSGTLAGANVTDVAVNCTTNTFTVGGTVSGLSGSGLVLQNNLGDNLSIMGNGAFVFATPVANGNAYSVTVLTQPGSLSQTCSVSNGAGTVGAADVTDVQVTCVTNSFTVGGTMSGLAGSGLVLRNNGGDDLAVNANGAFTFTTALADGSDYAVTVLTQPGSPSQTCTVSNGSGSVAGASITTVAVTCVTDPPVVSLSSAAVSFGGVILGEATTATVTISNNGNGDLLISQLTAPDAPFSIIDGSCAALPVTLLAGESCTVVFGFAPTSGGLFSGTFTIVSNAASSPNTLLLSGTGNAPAVMVPTLERTGLWLLVLVVALVGGLGLRRAS